MLWNPKHDLPAETKADPIADVLRRAADRIERLGHCKHALGTIEGPNCLLGAIIHEADDKDLAERAVIHFTARTGIAWRATWNNAPERTKEEVVSALRAAAES
jgi:hypothetical protein